VLATHIFQKIYQLVAKYSLQPPKNEFRPEFVGVLKPDWQDQ